MCVCEREIEKECVCACARGRDREKRERRGGGGERERERAKCSVIRQCARSDLATHIAPLVNLEGEVFLTDQVKCGLMDLPKVTRERERQTRAACCCCAPPAAAEEPWHIHDSQGPILGGVGASPSVSPLTKRVSAYHPPIEEGTT